MLSLPQPRHMPCERCGASIDSRVAAEHACEEGRRLDYVVFQLRGEISGLEAELAAWLETPGGRFALFYAERTRPR